jgi:hypothetical protein
MPLSILPRTDDCIFKLLFDDERNKDMPETDGDRSGILDTKVKAEQ